MEAVYYQLQAKHALHLPAGVSQHDPTLFAVAGQPTVREILHSVNHGKSPEEDKPVMPDTPAAAADSKSPASSSQLPATPASTNALVAESTHLQSNAGQTTLAASAAAESMPTGDKQQQGQSQPTASPFAAAAADTKASIGPSSSALHEPLQDTWVYRDPNWEVQGPFSKADILDWFEGGYFPADLPIKHANSPQADFKPLAAQIKIWAAAAPPGFARQEPHSSLTAAAQPATPAQQAPVDQQQPQPLSTPASGHQAQQQPQTDMDRAFTLTSADSAIAHHMGPSTASSARLDALETGSNAFAAAEPTRAEPDPAGMSFINNLIRGSSGGSVPQHSLPTPSQGADPLAHYLGLQQTTPAAAAWGHQTQNGRAASGQFDTSSPHLGLVGSGLSQSPFGQGQYSQPAPDQAPQQHALPAFLTGGAHLQDRSPSVHHDGGIFGPTFVPHSSANLDHLGAAGLNSQPQQHQWVSFCSRQPNSATVSWHSCCVSRPYDLQLHPHCWITILLEYVHACLYSSSNAWSH